VGTDITVVIQNQCMSCSLLPEWLITQGMWQRQHDWNEEGTDRWDKHPNGMHIRSLTDRQQASGEGPERFVKCIYVKVS